jgi:predicted TPR repeat methyltransferase
MASRSSGNLQADRRYAHARGYLKDGDHLAAADLFGQALELAPGWAPALMGLGEALEASGQTQAAIIAYRQARVAEPSDELGAGLRLARLGVAEADSAMTQEYVAALFDEYAPRFDAHLTEVLEYRGPDIIVAALEEACKDAGREFHFDSALDIGCGTGLMAKALWRRVDAMHGIDLSPRMVEKALASGFYHESHLHVGDAVAFLESERGAQFDLLMAADVLVYLGDLARFFAAARRAMTLDALLVFTVQSKDGDGFEIGADLRYHHSEPYLRAATAAADLRLSSLRPCVTRTDAGKPVTGLVVVAERRDAKHSD